MITQKPEYLRIACCAFRLEFGGNGLAALRPRHIAATCDAHYVKQKIYTVLAKCALLYDLGKRKGRLLPVAFFFLFLRIVQRKL